MVRLLAERCLKIFFARKNFLCCIVMSRISRCSVTGVFSREWDAMRDLIEGDMQLLEKTFRYTQGGNTVRFPILSFLRVKLQCLVS
jgi:hypothetical protein